MKNEPTQAKPKPNRRRPVKILLYVDEAEKAVIDEKAAALKMNRSEYIRAMATGGMTRPEKEDFAKVLRELGRIGNNINQLAKYANERGVFTDIKTFRDLTEEFRKWLYSKK